MTKLNTFSWEIYPSPCHPWQWSCGFWNLQSGWLVAQFCESQRVTWSNVLKSLYFLVHGIILYWPAWLFAPSHGQWIDVLWLSKGFSEIASKRWWAFSMQPFVPSCSELNNILLVSKANSIQDYSGKCNIMILNLPCCFHGFHHPCQFQMPTIFHPIDDSPQWCLFGFTKYNTELSKDHSS